MSTTIGRPLQSLREQLRPSGRNQWEWAALLLRCAHAIAHIEGRSSGWWEALRGAEPTLFDTLARLAPQIQGILDEMEVGLPAADVHPDTAFALRARELAAAVEVNAEASLDAGGQAWTLVRLSQAVPQVDDIQVGLALLNHLLLDSAGQALTDCAGQAILLFGDLEGRSYLVPSAQFDRRRWHSLARERWLATVQRIFTFPADDELGPLGNVVIVTSTESKHKRCPMAYVPRPLVPAFTRAAIEAVNQRPPDGTGAEKFEEKRQKTREWLEANGKKGGYGRGDLADHPAGRLIDSIVSGIPLPAGRGKLCIYCGAPAEGIETAKVSEGAGVKKFSKEWVLTGNRQSAKLCARCGLASFLQARRLGTFAVGGECGPKRYFVAFHQGAYSNSETEEIWRWLNLYYRITQESAALRREFNQVAAKPIRAKLQAVQNHFERLEKIVSDMKLPGLDLSPTRSAMPSQDQLDAVLEELGPFAERDQIPRQEEEQFNAAFERAQQCLRQVGQSVPASVRSAFERPSRDSAIDLVRLVDFPWQRVLAFALPMMDADQTKRFENSRVAITLALGWLWRQFPGSYWYRVPVGHDDNRVHTPWRVLDERDIQQAEAVWRFATRVCGRPDYALLVVEAEHLTEAPHVALAKILRQQGDEHSRYKRLGSEEWFELTREVLEAGRG